MKMLFILSFIFMTIMQTYIVADDEKQMWNVSDVGSISIFDWAQAIDLNDNGLVLFKSKTTWPNIDIWAIGNHEATPIILPELSTFPGQGSIGIYAQKIIWQRLNNLNLAIGTRRIVESRKDESTFQLVTWSQQEGFKTFFIEHCKNPSFDPVLAQCSNSGNILLTSNDKLYSLINDQMIDLTPILMNRIEEIGMNYYEVKWLGIAINSNGLIYGKFEAFNKHPLKNSPVFDSRHYFTLNGKEFTLIDLPDGVKLNINDSIKHLNNNNEVLCVFGKSYKWSKNSGLSELYCLQDNQIGSANAILDDNTVVFSFHSNSLLFSINEVKSYLYFNQENHSDNINTSNYSALTCNGLKMEKCLINNNKQMVFTAKFFGENHPFLLTPE